MSTYIRGAGRQGPQRHVSTEYRAAGPAVLPIDRGVAPQDTLAGERPPSTDNHSRGGRRTTAAASPSTENERPALSGTVVPAGSVDAQSLNALAWILDDLVRIPGINVRVGLDAVIGLVPGIGDSIGTALSSVILIGSVRHRVPMHVLLQMAWNILVDTLLGFIPGVGDVADAVHRANRKNYDLLRETVESGKQVDAGYRGYALRAGSLVAGIITALVAATLVTLWVIFQGLGALLG